MFWTLNLISLTVRVKAPILMWFFQEKIRSKYFLLIGKTFFRIQKGGSQGKILTQMKVNMQRRKTAISYLTFCNTFLFLSCAIIEVTTKATIRWFLYMNLFYNNFGAINLYLKSQEMRKFQENLKIGCRHSLRIKAKN